MPFPTKLLQKSEVVISIVVSNTLNMKLLSTSEITAATAASNQQRPISCQLRLQPLFATGSSLFAPLSLFFSFIAPWSFSPLLLPPSYLTAPGIRRKFSGATVNLIRWRRPRWISRISSQKPAACARARRAGEQHSRRRNLKCFFFSIAEMNYSSVTKDEKQIYMLKVSAGQRLFIKRLKALLG